MNRKPVVAVPWLGAVRLAGPAGLRGRVGPHRVADLVAVRLVREGLGITPFLGVGRLVALDEWLVFMLHLVIQMGSVLVAAPLRHHALLPTQCRPFACWDQCFHRSTGSSGLEGLEHKQISLLTS